MEEIIYWNVVGESKFKLGTHYAQVVNIKSPISTTPIFTTRKAR